jgi:endonuclease/exonuclease/phosphatase family metal-dependent hydrolase
MTRLLLCFAALLLLGGSLACAESPLLAGDAVNVQPTVVPAETSFEASSGPVSLRFMSYNVLWGGGLERRFDQNFLAWQHPIFDGRDRFAQIMAVIRRANPDVLAVQEAAAWDEGKPSVAERVATELGMSYVFVKNPYQINVALFSKLPILSSVDLVGPMGSNAALVATLRSPDGGHIYVAAAHLDPFTSRMRECQVGMLLRALAPVAGQRVVLMGDMNFRPSANAFRLLQEAGWQSVAVAESLPIDQIWLGQWEGWSSEAMWEAGSIEANLSDHYPVGARIDFGERRVEPGAVRIEAPAEGCIPG